MEERMSNFLTEIIEADLAEGKVKEIHTRFPPEPNGYLHIGSAKAIYINYTIAKQYGGKFNLRFDDTNPSHEDVEYVDSIQQDLEWLGAIPNGGVYYGSDYFDKCYEYAELLIKEGKAYVDDLSREEMQAYRGQDAGKPSRPSPYRDRTPEENLDLFRRMRAGEFPDGSKTLRAKIDLASPNMNMRDPAIYRIMRAHHHRQGDKWCIYPLYDFAHPIQDAIEGITHSMCSLEFENHRPLYEWVIDNLHLGPFPIQREFARLNVTNTVMSKRYLRKLVETGVTDGWDDPRMPTLCGLRRRGYTPTSIFEFVRRAGVAKAYSLVDNRLLEHCIRTELETTALRRMAVIDPVKLTITNYPEGQVEYFDVANNPNKAANDSSTRPVAFSGTVWIERSDFAEVPPPKFQRLKPDGEVRLMGAYIVKCNEVVKDEAGNIVELKCTADLETRNGMPADGRKVRGTIHWVSAAHAVDAEVHLYDNLFTEQNMGELPEDKTYDDYLNPDSVKVLPNAKLEACLEGAQPGERFQFVRMGYFTPDSKHPGTYNRIVTLKDSFSKTLG
ncbi:glutamine--tRNA ligase [Anaerofilum sp. An201]|nr:glutamine--tRNA ligase/YqeY domain fusion protein [Anaerofilum sp. An201]OUP05275.1 glutamine--tRNA ligase [Anaerofilum sp. An201]